jgi:hypothetical protein
VVNLRYTFVNFGAKGGTPALGKVRDALLLVGHLVVLHGVSGHEDRAVGAVGHEDRVLARLRTSGERLPLVGSLFLGGTPKPRLLADETWQTATVGKKKAV